jgi:hypothetical protein
MSDLRIGSFHIPNPFGWHSADPHASGQAATPNGTAELDESGHAQVPDVPSLKPSHAQKDRQPLPYTRHELLRDVSRQAFKSENGDVEGLNNLTRQYRDQEPQTPIDHAGQQLQKRFDESPNGLDGKVFYNPDNHEYIVAFSGTNQNDIKDWVTDTQLGLPQYRAMQAELDAYTDTILKNDPNAKITFTGTSLGGGLAEIGAYQTQKNHPDARLSKLNNSPFDQATADKIFSTHYRIGGEPISKLGDHIMRPQNMFIMPYAGPEGGGIAAHHSLSAYPADFESAKQKDLPFHAA